MSKYYDKTAASFKSVTVDTKILDAQKILVNPATGDSTERVNILDLIKEAAGTVDTVELEQRVSILEDTVVGGYKTIEFKSNTTGASNETEGIAMQFSKAHFIPENVQLQQVSLPFTQEPRNLPNQYCHIWYYNDAEEVIAVHISNTTQSRTAGQTGKSTFTFPESCIVPESYKYARVFLSGVDYTIDFGRTSTYRINVVNKGGVVFDDDECCVWTSTSSNPNYLGDIEVTYGLPETILDTITSIEADLNNRIDDVEETLTEKVTNIENILFTYQDAVRDVNTMQGTLDNATIYGIQYSKEHFGIYDAKLSKVTIPYTTQSGQTNTGYLVAQVFDNDNQLIASYYSEGTHTFSNAGPAVFNFQDADIAANYKFIRFVLVANKTVSLPTAYNSVNSNCLSFRARPIKWSDSFTFDDDDCLSYSNQSTGTQNWLIGMTIDYKERIAPAMDNFVTREELNEQLENLEPQEIDTSNLAKLNTSNTFTGDIVLRGGKLILANGSQLEIEEGDYIPGEPGTNMAPSITQLQQDVEQLRTDMTQADSSLQRQIDNIPNLTDDVNDLTQRVIDLEQGNSGGGSGTSDYTEVKEDVEYHLQNKMTHMSFTDRIVMDNLYTVEEGSFSKYYTSNNVDNVTEFTDAVCSSFTLHAPSILLDTTLGVLQIPYSGSAQVQCSLKIVCYDAKTKTNLIEATSINVVDYSTGAGNANFFFEPFVLPFKTEEVVCSFVKADGTNVQAPVKLVTTTPTNGDQYNNQDSYVDGRVYVLQYTPAVHINTFVRDLDDCRWPMLTLQEDGSYSIAFDTFIGMQSISLTPHPENGNSIVVNNLGLGLNSGFTAINGAEPTFFSCMCVFTNMTEEAYVKLNGHTLYTGSTDGGLSFSDQISLPFPIDMLIGPGDTIEISPYVQLRAIRFTGGRYV